jgi:signal recognition particle receptor subunit beta
MVLFNYSTKELTAKIVYYGPGLCGKTTNLQFIHENLSSNVKGKMLSLATKTDRTLFFDFLPMDLGEIRGMKTRMQLYTVPGQVFYNETRKLVLKGVDGLVFVADSQKEMIGPNIESFKNLEENLKGHGHKLAEMPHVIQFNKRDLPKLASVEELNAAINKYNAPFYETVATTGIGVQDSLKAITKLVLLHLTKKYDPRTGAAKRSSVQVPAAKVPAAAAPPAPEPVPVAAAPVPVSTPDPQPVTVAASASSSPTASATPEGSSSISEPETAMASSMTTHDVPVSIADEPMVDSLGPDTMSAAPQASFAGEEIDGLMDEVEDEVPQVDSAPQEESGESSTRSFEADGADGPQIQVNVESVPGEERTIEQVSEVLTDQDLFNDPSLEIAHLAAGQTREIVIPVQITGQDETFRRYKLSLRMKLDPVE